MPEVLSTSPFAPESLKQAIATQLEQAPSDALTVTATYQMGGVWRADAVVKIDRDRWVLAAGGFAESDGQRTNYGVLGTVTIRF